MLFYKSSIYVSTLLCFLMHPALGVEITRDVVFNVPLLDMDVTVDAGFAVSFLSQGSVPISMENGDIANNGVFCLGNSNFGTISSGTITNNGPMFLQAENVERTQALQATTLINNNFLTFYGGGAVNLSITESFINKGLIYFNFPDNPITIEGPASGIVNDGVIDIYFTGQATISISSIVGTGCVVLNQGNFPAFDLSKSFNQTIYVEDGYSWIRFFGKQLPDSIPVVRAADFSNGRIMIVVGSAETTPERPTFIFNNITGIAVSYTHLDVYKRQGL